MRRLTDDPPFSAAPDDQPRPIPAAPSAGYTDGDYDPAAYYDPAAQAAAYGLAEAADHDATQAAAEGDPFGLDFNPAAEAADYGHAPGGAHDEADEIPGPDRIQAAAGLGAAGLAAERAVPPSAAAPAPRLKPRRRPEPAWLRRTRKFGLPALAAATISGGAAWLATSPVVADFFHRVHQGAANLAAQGGLRVQEIYVTGRQRTPPEHLLAALDLNRGDPVLGFDLDEARHRVQSLPWVFSATIERQLPGTIRLTITERYPIAIWQNQGQFTLIDKEGREFPADMNEHADLPLVVGEDAPANAAALLAVLQTEPQLMARVKAAVRVSGRRWNLKMDRMEDGIDVRLPEDDMAGAWKRLAQLEREQKVLDRKLTMVDLRMPDRLVVRTAPEDIPPPLSAKPHKPLPGKDA